MCRDPEEIIIEIILKQLKKCSLLCDFLVVKDPHARQVTSQLYNPAELQHRINTISKYLG